MAARSTTQGTPVKSCSRTRAGMKEISFASGVAAHHVLDIGCLHLAAVLLAKQILQQNAVRNGQARDVRQALFFERCKTEISVFSTAHLQSGFGTEAVLAHGVVFNISDGFRWQALRPG